MSQFIDNVQYRIKSSSSSIFLFLFKIASGAMIGLTFALIGQEMIGYETLSFVIVIMAVTGAFLKIAKPWGWGGVAIFDLICVLVGILLRMYIRIAPGA